MLIYHYDEISKILYLRTLTFPTHLSEAAQGSYHDLLRSPDLQQLTNGTLLLTKVDKSTAGRYVCEATNGIGAGLSKVIQVTVNGKCLLPVLEQSRLQSLYIQTTMSCYLKSFMIHSIQSTHKSYPLK